MMKTKKNKVGDFEYTVRAKTLREALMASEVEEVAERMHPDSVGKQANARAEGTVYSFAGCIITHSLTIPEGKDPVQVLTDYILGPEFPPEGLNQIVEDIQECAKIEEVAVEHF